MSSNSNLKNIDDEAFRNCKGLTSLTLPSSLENIGTYAFFGCTGLTSLTILSPLSSSLKMGFSVFEGCTGLTSLTLPSNLESIGSSMFEDCTGLTSLTLPSWLKSIGNEAFEGCTGLTSLTLPSSLNKLGANAFKNCSGLRSIYAYRPYPVDFETKYYVFEGCNDSECILYVPKGAYKRYKENREFGYFKNIVEFDPTGIDAVSTNNDAKEVSRYTVDGQQLSAPTKGLNIVKYSDGTMKKVMVP